MRPIGVVMIREDHENPFEMLLILNGQHLERILDVFVQHYNGHRPHRALAMPANNSVLIAAIDVSGFRR
jgi:hypothetical protein